MITIDKVTKNFGTLQVLKGISLHVEPHEIVSIMGPSGAGKTTLLQLIGTLDRPNSGSIRVNNTDVLTLDDRSLSQFRNRHIGFVFQFHQLLPEFSALENVMMPALIAGNDFATARREAQKLLDYLQLTNRSSHKPAQLSGGEKQRVAVARALVNHPSVVLADEPSGSLDSHNKEELHRLFRDIRDNFGQTILIVTHDHDLAAISDRILEMRDGNIINS